ncbi:MAG TPA: hypothetical protein VFZ25_07625, partial [Chloroflexota bacterium]|nr:hypothetical protein [Chloroflexota bacterium]
MTDDSNRRKRQGGDGYRQDRSARSLWAETPPRGSADLRPVRVPTIQSRFADALRDREIGRAEVGAARVQLALIFAAVRERAPALVAELASQADLSEATALAMVDEWRHPRRNAASLLADGTGRVDFAAALELREAGRQRIVT